MPNIYELLATEKQCKGYLMLKDQDGSCSYCVEGLIARTLNLPEYKMTKGVYAFGDPQYKITEAGLPREIPLDLLESLGYLPERLKALQAETKQNSFSLVELNDGGITFQQFAILFEALGVPRGITD